MYLLFSCCSPLARPLRFSFYLTLLGPREFKVDFDRINLWLAYIGYLVVNPAVGVLLMWSL